MWALSNEARSISKPASQHLIGSHVHVYVYASRVADTPDISREHSQPAERFEIVAFLQRPSRANARYTFLRWLAPLFRPLFALFVSRLSPLYFTPLRDALCCNYTITARDIYSVGGKGIAEISGFKRSSRNFLFSGGIKGDVLIVVEFRVLLKFLSVQCFLLSPIIYLVYIHLFLFIPSFI